MSDTTGDRAYARDAKKQTLMVWISLPVFFIGCGLLTVAVVELASNKHISAVTAVIGGPLVVIGLAVLIIRGRLRGET